MQYAGNLGLLLPVGVLYIQIVTNLIGEHWREYCKDLYYRTRFRLVRQPIVNVCPKNDLCTC